MKSICFTRRLTGAVSRLATEIRDTVGVTSHDGKARWNSTVKSRLFMVYNVSVS